MLSALDTFDTGDETPKVWVVGNRNILNGPQSQYIKYCEVWNPQKKMVHRDSVCRYTQEIVTDDNEGSWTFNFGIDGKLLEDKTLQEIKVEKSKGTSLL